MNRRGMDCHLELMGNWRGQEASEVVHSKMSNKVCRSTKLGDKFKLERNDSSSANFHRKVDDIPRQSKAVPQKQQQRSKADELVRYMSNLPSYLERGEIIEEKAFNFGVLEWRRLEKWQCKQGHVAQRSCKTSPSNSNASSVSSTEGSSTNSGRGISCSLARQRMQHSSVEPSCNSSASRVFSRSIKSFERNGRKFQDLASSSSNYVKVSQSILSTHKCFYKYTDNQLKECTNKDQNLMRNSEKRESQTQNSSAISGSERASGVECVSLVTAEQSFPGKNQLETMEATRRSFSDISYYDASKLSSDVPHSCPLPREANTAMTEKLSSSATRSIRSSEQVSHCGKFSASPSRDRNLGGKKSIQTFCSSPEVANLRAYTEEDGKVRHPSPIRRLVARIGRNSNTKDASCVPPSSPDYDNFRSRAAETAVYSVDSPSEKSNASGKGRSSPLRRLLDPLLKPRTSSVDNSIGSPQRDSKLQGEYAIRHPVKVKLDLGSCKTIDVDDPRDTGKREPLMVQALFQVAVKNGLPLFTFAVEDSSDILAATMRKLGSGKKDDNRWIYTFFTVHEMKKKTSSWLNQGKKDRSHSYIPNVVAQMKVSDVAPTDLIRPYSLDKFTTREFILVSTKNRQGDEQMSDLHTYDELAATVLKLPNMAMSKVEESSQEVFNSCESMHLKEGGSSVRNPNPFGLAVILPDGDHGLPSEGEPSPLLERWRSGGSCDCGGWDLGCRLKVLASQQTRGSSVSAKAQFSTGKCQLYSQNQDLDRKPHFSLSLFKDGIYSVEFDSSLKLLQAFSICIAALNGLQPAKLSEMGNSFEKKSLARSEADHSENV